MKLHVNTVRNKNKNLNFIDSMEITFKLFCTRESNVCNLLRRVFHKPKCQNAYYIVKKLLDLIQGGSERVSIELAKLPFLISK